MIINDDTTTWYRRWTVLSKTSGKLHAVIYQGKNYVFLCGYGLPYRVFCTISYVALGRIIPPEYERRANCEAIAFTSSMLLDNHIFDMEDFKDRIKAWIIGQSTPEKSYSIADIFKDIDKQITLQELQQ